MSIDIKIHCVSGSKTTFGRVDATLDSLRESVMTKDYITFNNKGKPVTFFTRHIEIIEQIS